jgi:hypothetical protein
MRDQLLKLPTHFFGCVQMSKIQKSGQLDSPPVETTAPAMADHQIANVFPGKSRVSEIN